MAKFPTRESDIVALAETMVSGYTTYVADFPSVTVADLETVLSDYKIARDSQIAAKSQMQQSTVAKENALAALVEEMKTDLKISEVDVVAEPEKLTEIGWGPKADPQHLTAPGQPDNFKPDAEGNGFVWLSWNKPTTGGRVTNYSIERRVADQSGVMGSWQFAQSGYDTKIKLTDQPCGVLMEYRCIATNAAGDSMPSNVAQVVL